MSSSIIYKSSELKAVGDDTYEFIASDETEDRYGDIVRVSGWDLKNYKKNPIVLFGHKHDMPVGTARKVWIDTAKKQLMVQIRLAQEGTSDFIDTLRKLVEQKIIRAVSVGFQTTAQPNIRRDPKTESYLGMEFVGQELLENSLVSVPANPSAIATAKSMGVSDAHIQRVFGSWEGKQSAFAHMARQKAQLEMIRLGATSSK